jgi:hypothetical protein
MINIIDTKNNLSLLKAKPPIVLVTSAEIRDATAQQSAAIVAMK